MAPVTSFATNIATRGSFFTDNNGYEFQQRKFSYDLNIEGNYYPIVYAAYIQGKYTLFGSFYKYFFSYFRPHKPTFFHY